MTDEGHFYSPLRLRRVIITVSRDLRNNYNVCVSVRASNLRASASGLSRRGGQTCYYYFILPSSVYTLLSMKYFVLKSAISGKVSISIYLDEGDTTI